MSASHQCVAIAAQFLLDDLAPRLRGGLARDTRAEAGPAAMRARIGAWLDDLQADRVETALDPARLASVLETLWKWGIVWVWATPGQLDPDHVDVAMKPEDVAVLDLAVAAVTALDTLRGSAAIAGFQRAQRVMIAQMLVMIAAKAGAHGAA